MSAISDVLTAIDTRLAATISGYTRLKHSYDLELNNLRDSAAGYAIVSGAAQETVGATKAITLDHDFGVILTRKFGGRANDTEERSVLNTIYGDLELLYRDFASSKLGIANTVLVVNNLSMDEPEKIADNVISVKMNFTVRHRKAT